jgi:cyclophilin family peptidyl-prolyl cis-trans isomerase
MPKPPLPIAFSLTLLAVAGALPAQAAATTAAAAKPVFSLAAGTYAGTQSVALSDATAGFDIHYTTNGAQPTAASARYVAPIAVAASETIKAIALAPGRANSAVASAAYRIGPTGIVAKPASLAFPVVNIGAKPVSRTVTLKNTGGTAVSTLSISLTGLGAGGYATSQTCGATLAAGASCTVTVTFGPQTSGDFAAMLQVTGSGSAAAAAPLDGLYTDVNDAAADGNTYAFDTTQGTMYVALRPDAAPKNVANFLHYVDNGTYAHTIIHRVVPGFINQAGGYKYNNAGVIVAAPTVAPVVLEPKLSNVRGTVAMARVGTNTASATDQFFFNVANNSALDTQDGGYTVIGQIMGVQGIVGASQAKGLAVMDTINADTVYNAGSPFDSIPLLNYTPPNTVEPSNIVYVNAVTQVKPQAIAPAVPVFSIASGTFTGPQPVSLQDATPGATIYYHVFGSADGNPIKYTGPFTVSQSRYVAAFAVAPGYPRASYVGYVHLIIK